MIWVQVKLILMIFIAPRYFNSEHHGDFNGVPFQNMSFDSQQRNLLQLITTQEQNRGINSKRILPISPKSGIRFEKSQTSKVSTAKKHTRRDHSNNNGRLIKTKTKDKSKHNEAAVKDKQHLKGIVKKSLNSSGSLPGNLDVHIVYFAFIHQGPKWKWLISEQLKDLKRCGLLTVAKLHIALSTPLNTTFQNGTLSNTDLMSQQLSDAMLLINSAKGHIKNVLGKSAKYDFNVTIGNYFEFPGISLVSHLSRSLTPVKARSTIFLYFHTKGMVYYSTKKLRRDAIMMQTVVFRWKTAIKHFASDHLLNKAGFAASTGGITFVLFSLHVLSGIVRYSLYTLIVK